MELPVIQQLRKELSELTNELNTKIPRLLAEAAAHGDLTENAEYDAAKARQEFVRTRVGQLNRRISELSLFSFDAIPQGVVAYGSRVKLEDVDEGESEEFELVFPEEVNAAGGQISVSSPLGRALLNRAEGDEVEVQTPRGKKTYQIMTLQTLHERDVSK
jgi:transcription elongation factor GreA